MTCWRWYGCDATGKPDPQIAERDLDAVIELHVTMENKIGRELPLPDLCARPIVAAIVLEDEGVVTHALYLEAEVELGAVGPNPIPHDRAKAALLMLSETTRFYNIAICRAFVPASMLAPARTGKAAPLFRTLDRLGFKQENDALTQFYLWTNQPADTTRPAETVNAVASGSQGQES